MSNEYSGKAGESGGGGTVNGEEQAEVDLKAFRLLRLQLAANGCGVDGVGGHCTSGGVEGAGERGEKAPQSPPVSGGRRLSRLWMGRRHSYRLGQESPSSPPPEISSKVRSFLVLDFLDCVIVVFARE